MNMEIFVADSFLPGYVLALLPLAGLSLLSAAVTAAVLVARRCRNTGASQNPTDPPVLRLALLGDGLLLAGLLVCGALTISYHARVTEPSVQAYSRQHSDAQELRTVTNREYRNAAMTWLIGVSSTSATLFWWCHSQRAEGGTGQQR
jgi:hypothetical protein